MHSVARVVRWGLVIMGGITVGAWLLALVIPGVERPQSGAVVFWLAVILIAGYFEKRSVDKAHK